MAISDTLAKSIVQNLQEELGSSTFHDVIISVQNTEFKSHKLILSANSKYFKNIFTSEIGRTSSESIILNNVSPETFRLVLDCIYGGKDVLTAANLAEIWHAAVYLEIDFLYQACELYQTSRVTKENCVEMTNQATTFKSKKLKEAAWNMIVKEFKDISMRADVVLLESEDLFQIINNEDLAIDSEDYVVNAILKWVQHSPEASDQKSYDDSEKDYKSREKELQKENCNSSLKKRKNDIVDMLKASRLCLASGRCLQSLLGVKVIAENKKCFSVLHEALQYHLLQDRRGYYCPPQAIHRKSSKLQNVILSVKIPSQGQTNFNFSCRTLDGTWYHMPFPPCNPCFVTSYGQSIYSVGSNYPLKNSVGSINLHKYCTNNGKWLTLQGFGDIHTGALIGLDDYLYAVSCTVYRLILTEGASEDWENVGKILVSVQNVTLSTFQSTIVILGNDINSRQLKVQFFDTLTFTCSVYTDQLPDHFAFSKTFQIFNDSYFLLSTGEVLKLTKCDNNKPRFENIGKILQTACLPQAAVIFKDNLIVAVNNIPPQTTRKWDTQLIDGVKTVEIIERQSTFMINAAIPKSQFLTLLKKE